MNVRQSDLERVIARLPTALCVMTAAYERARAGVLAQWIMQCSTEPLLVCLAIPKGSRVGPVIRDSHTFGVCLIDGRARLLVKKFEIDSGEDDPFDSFELRTLRSGSPILARSIAALDCEVVRHFDLEATHELYVGQVLDARMLDGGHA